MESDQRIINLNKSSERKISKLYITSINANILWNKPPVKVIYEILNAILFIITKYVLR